MIMYPELVNKDQLMQIIHTQSIILDKQDEQLYDAGRNLEDHYCITREEDLT